MCRVSFAKLYQKNFVVKDESTVASIGMTKLTSHSVTDDTVATRQHSWLGGEHLWHRWNSELLQSADMCPSILPAAQGCDGSGGSTEACDRAMSVLTSEGVQIEVKRPIKHTRARHLEHVKCCHPQLRAGRRSPADYPSRYGVVGGLRSDYFGIV